MPPKKARSKSSRAAKRQKISTPVRVKIEPVEQVVEASPSLSLNSLESSSVSSPLLDVSCSNLVGPSLLTYDDFDVSYMTAGELPEVNLEELYDQCEALDLTTPSQISLGSIHCSLLDTANCSEVGGGDVKNVLSDSSDQSDSFGKEFGQDYKIEFDDALLTLRRLSEQEIDHQAGGDCGVRKLC